MPITKLHPCFCFASLLLFCNATLPYANEKVVTIPMTLKSSAFTDQNTIPKVFTCDDKNISPPLMWSGIPQNSKSLALIVYDPDVPAPFLPLKIWTHWVLYNIPHAVTELPQNISPENLPQGTLQGRNDWKKTGYNGPCPPFGTHRYVFKLYALDTVLPSLNQPDRATLEKAMEGHIVTRAQLIGNYKR